MRAIGTNGAFSLEFRLRFPGPTNEEIPPTETTGELVTVMNDTQTERLEVWYEKSTATNQTGTVFLTSSAGRLSLTNVPVFDDDFYNFSVVKETLTGSISLAVMKYEGGEVSYSTSSYATSGSAGWPADASFTHLQVGSTDLHGTLPEFWAQEVRAWDCALTDDELVAHTMHFESYGRHRSHDNQDLKLHMRLNDGSRADGSGIFFVYDSTDNSMVSGTNAAANEIPFTKTLEEYSYIPSVDYGWNQEKIRTYDGSSIDHWERYEDDRLVSLEFNMYDALNEDISHLMVSYDEMIDLMGLPLNRYREEYEGFSQMRETYFKRLQGKLNFRVFADMLDFFDTSFVSVIEKMLPARVLFKGDEMVIESHMLERPKYQYQARPIREGVIDISGSIAMTDRDWDYYL